MNYTSFCDYLFASLKNQLAPGTIITKESIRKNNGVVLDAFLIRFQGSAGAPVVYLDSLYDMHLAGSSVEQIGNLVVARLSADLPLSLELIRDLHTFEGAKHKIVFRLVSRDSNRELLKEVPWMPFLDLAVIFYIYLGVRDDQHISSIVKNSQAKLWRKTPDDLMRLALINTPRLYPHHLSRLEQLLFGWDDDELLHFPDASIPPLYLLTNASGINGAACLLYEDIIKNFADTLCSDLIILPSSIHEVLIVPDSHETPYEMYRRMVRSVNAEDVPTEDILSDQIYLYRRGDASISQWVSSCSDTPEPHASESP